MFLTNKVYNSSTFKWKIVIDV